MDDGWGWGWGWGKDGRGLNWWWWLSYNKWWMMKWGWSDGVIMGYGWMHDDNDVKINDMLATHDDEWWIKILNI